MNFNRYKRFSAFMVLITLGSSIAAFPAMAADRFGAIAMSPTTGAWGVTFDYGSRVVAEREALRQCGQSDCNIRIWFKNQCAALVHNDQSMAWGLGDTLQTAQANALDALGTSGQTLAQVCSSRR